MGSGCVRTGRILCGWLTRESGRGSWDDVEKAGEDHSTPAHTGQGQKLGCYSKYHEKPLEDLKRGSDMLSLMFLKYVENEWTEEGQKWISVEPVRWFLFFVFKFFIIGGAGRKKTFLLWEMWNKYRRAETGTTKPITCLPPGSTINSRPHLSQQHCSVSQPLSHPPHCKVIMKDRRTYIIGKLLLQ